MSAAGYLGRFRAREISPDRGAHGMLHLGTPHLVECLQMARLLYQMHGAHVCIINAKRFRHAVGKCNHRETSAARVDCCLCSLNIPCDALFLSAGPPFLYQRPCWPCCTRCLRRYWASRMQTVYNWPRAEHGVRPVFLALPNMYPLSTLLLLPLASTAASRAHSAILHERRDNAPSGFFSIGPAPTDQILTLHLGLAQSNISGLEQRVLAVSTPSSSEYGKFLTKEEVTLVSQRCSVGAHGVS
jgi:hypothetical protein